MSANTTPNTTPVKKCMTWDADTDKQLLLAILAQVDYKFNSEVIAEKFGPWCTPRAVEERVKKLKKQSQAENHATSPFAPGQSTRVEARIRAERAAAIEAFEKDAAEKKAAKEAAAADDAEQTPTKSAKDNRTSRSKKAPTTPVSKGKGQATELANEDGSVAETSDNGSTVKKRKYIHYGYENTNDPTSKGSPIGHKLAQKAQKAVGKALD